VSAALTAAEHVVVHAPVDARPRRHLASDRRPTAEQTRTRRTPNPQPRALTLDQSHPLFERSKPEPPRARL